MSIIYRLSLTIVFFTLFHKKQNNYSVLASGFSDKTTTISNIDSLKSCLGSRLINLLVTPGSSFSSDPYYQYSWLKTGI
jgi:hypothetical protein